MTEPKSLREQVLADGIALTTGDRDQTYGHPLGNLTLQYRLWALYAAAAGTKYSAGHEAAIQHVIAKLARIGEGKRFHRDNYVDLATYSAIAYECDMQAAAAAVPAPVVEKTVPGAFPRWAVPPGTAREAPSTIALDAGIAAPYRFEFEGTELPVVDDTSAFSKTDT